MPTMVGYGRTSTSDQRYGLDAQREELLGAGVVEKDLYTEQVSAKAGSSRPQLEAALRALRPNDTFVVTRIDRLGRSVIDLMKIVERIEAAGARLLVTSQSIDTAKIEGRLLLAILAAVAQMERDMISARTRESLATRPPGKRGGRKPVLSPANKRRAVELFVDRGLGAGEVAGALGVSRATIYRALGEAGVFDRDRQAQPSPERTARGGPPHS